MLPYLLPATAPISVYIFNLYNSTGIEPVHRFLFTHELLASFIIFSCACYSQVEETRHFLTQQAEIYIA